MEAASKTKFRTVDEYLSTLPEGTKFKLQELRETVRKAAPQAEELISYNMPAVKLRSVLVYYAARKGYIGFYPTASPIQAFKKELSSYEGSKGAVKFPIDKPIPSKLVSKIVKYRVKEDLEKQMKK